MRDRPLLLDLFCGGGGSAVGYDRAGFNVLGVDHGLFKRYPFSHAQEDALAVAGRLAEGKSWRGYRARDFAAIHASPPCQRYSIGTKAHAGRAESHPDLLSAVRAALAGTGRPWVIENVEGAPMRPPAVRLCGLMFGLRLFRHRWFESNVVLFAPDHPPHRGRRIGVAGMVCMAGRGGQSSGWSLRKRRVPADHRNKAAWVAASGIDWMTRDEMAQAIPPAYTYYLGCQLMTASWPVAQR